MEDRLARVQQASMMESIKSRGEIEDFVRQTKPPKFVPRLQEAQDWLIELYVEVGL